MLFLEEEHRVVLVVLHKVVEVAVAVLDRIGQELHQLVVLQLLQFRLVQVVHLQVLLETITEQWEHHHFLEHQLLLQQVVMVQWQMVRQKLAEVLADLAAEAVAVVAPATTQMQDPQRELISQEPLDHRLLLDGDMMAVLVYRVVKDTLAVAVAVPVVEVSLERMELMVKVEMVV
tara:strand:+ start:962 stop:1486 length:525 start_codon:yes stop_codon:yes gene_type:complete